MTNTEILAYCGSSYPGSGYLFVWPQGMRGMRHLVPFELRARTLCGRPAIGWEFELPTVAELEPDVGCSVCRRAAKRRAARAT